MKNVFNIKSKVYVKPKRSTYLFKQILNICLIFVLIVGIMQLILDGISIGVIGEIALAIFIVTSYNKRPTVNPHYESSVIEIEIDSEKMNVEYKQLEDSIYANKILEIRYEDVFALEYSNQLCCLHIMGHILVKDKYSETICEHIKDHYLYLERGMEKEILSCIEKNINLKIKYMDGR